MPRKIRTSLVLLALLVVPWTGFAASSDVSFSSAAEIEVAEITPKGETILVRRPAQVVPPGTVIIYSNLITNSGKVAKENLVVTNPIPLNSEYVAGSAETPAAAVVFSVDGGKSYAPPKVLTLPDGKGGKRPAEPKDYTHIRWTLKAPLKPGTSGLVEFRARVK